MSIIINDNFAVNVGKPVDSKYLNVTTPWTSVSAVQNGIPASYRYIGLTVNINGVEYWWKSSTSNDNLIEKVYTGGTSGNVNYISGATNLGFFSGKTGAQSLVLSGFASSPIDFNDTYYSAYNNYYVDNNGIITIGRPTADGPYRRAYVNASKTASWIYSNTYGTSGGWVISYNDVTTNVGSSVNLVSYDGTAYDEYYWDNDIDNDFYTNGYTSVLVYGSLNTGDTLVIGNPIYNNTTYQRLNLRTIKSITPEFLNVDYDDNFINFSGISSITNAQNFGTGIGVYSGQSGSILGFRTLVGSGDTLITTDSTGDIVIFSSSNGSTDTITGATNNGGGVEIYNENTDRNLQFNTLIGSGDTTVTKVGNQVIINSQGGGVFASDILVSIAAGKTFGKYINGDVIPASGKTADQVIQMALSEALTPTVNLGSSTTNVVFGLDSKTVNVTFSYSINTVGASVATTLLEWRRGNTGSWSGLTTNTGATSYFLTVDDTVNRFNTAVINLRYTVTDTAGATKTVTYDVIPQAYVAPTITPTYVASGLQSYETQTIREVGNVNTTIAGGISSNRTYVNILSYEIQRNDGSGYVTIASENNINSLSTLIISYLDDESSLTSTTISYRIVVTDEYQTTTSSVYVINLRFASYYGYNSNTVLTSAQIVGLHNEVLLISKIRTLSSVTATASQYTYISYPSSFGDLSNIILDGSAPVLGAFTKLSDVIVTNYYGQTVTNSVYKSNALGAFTNNTLALS
jgi:hypothetical protein